MKLMAIDLGSKRVGIASTDDSGEYALPRAVWPNTKALLEKIIEFKNNNEIEKIIIGESLNLNKESNPIHKKVLLLKKELEKEGIMVDLHPEVFTTVEARRLQGNNELTDASAAALILKSYIESSAPTRNRT